MGIEADFYIDKLIDLFTSVYMKKDRIEFSLFYICNN